MIYGVDSDQTGGHCHSITLGKALLYCYFFSFFQKTYADLVILLAINKGPYETAVEQADLGSVVQS